MPRPKKNKEVDQETKEFVETAKTKEKPLDFTIKIPEMRTTPSGENHGCINVLTNSNNDTNMGHYKEEIREKVIRERLEDCRMVKARYINHRSSSERLEAPYCKYPGDPILQFKLIPNETYELPLGMVKEVNDERTRLAQRSEICDANGVPTMKAGESLLIHELVPVGF